MELEDKTQVRYILGKLLYNESCWLQPGPHSDIVISSRIRLARNIVNLPFPHRANDDVLRQIRSKIYTALEDMTGFKDRWFLNIEEISELDRQFLVERHLISYEHTLDGAGKGLVITPDEGLSIMINEEDHLRMQVIVAGFDLKKAWEKINSLDDELSMRIEFAFCPQLGYLTSCPTNTGTGMRGSVMMHLPALVITKQINRVLQTISKLNFTARGLYGEGTQAMGNIFQISNQACLGYSEEELVGNIERVIRQIIEQEEMAREKIMRTSRLMLEDRVWRAYGLLKNARIMNSAEALEYLSMLRLGLDLGLIKDVELKVINDLFIIIQPAHLQKISGRRLSSRQRDIKRANILRNRLTNKMSEKNSDLDQEERGNV